MSIEHFLHAMEQALHLTNIAADDEFRDYDNWDSLMFLSLVAVLDKEFGFKADLDFFAEIDTWQEMYDGMSEQKN